MTFGAVGLILLATGAVTITTQLSSRASVDKLWSELAVGLSEYGARESLRFLEPAVPLCQGVAELVARGQLDLTDDARVLAHLEVELDTNPNVTWASLGRADGTYLSVLRWPTPEGERVRRTHRTLRPDAPAGARTLFRDAERDDATGAWTQLPETAGDYDPRVRPWWGPAAALPPGEGTWVDPFIYASRKQPGVNYSLAIRNDAGELLGVVSAEFEASPLSDFLSGLDVGDSGRAYLVTKDGAVVAHPGHELVRDGPDGAPAIRHAADHPDPMLRTAWDALQDGAMRPGEPAELGPYLAMAQPLPAEAGIPWYVLTVVPSDDFYGSVRRQGRRSLWISLLVVLAAAIIGFALSRRLARTVNDLGAEMHRLAHFEISESGFEATHSVVRELNDMGEATGVMKAGLASFGRYVPHQLVRQLLRTGVEARLGGHEREVTVLFSDIAGFTPVVESTPANTVLEALGDYLAEMNEAIARTDGTVCQYLGDAIMAFWGAPEAQADHALRACRGALAMREAALALEARAPERGLPALPTRFGLNSGSVMVGNIGAPNRFNYGILGDPVNAASRVEGLNKLYGTWLLLGEETAMQVRDALVLRRVDRVRMKGKRRAMDVYELLGEPDAIDPDRAAGAERYEVALVAYFERDFASALDGFREAGRALGGDPASDLLASRCEAYLAAPPPEGWDGVFEMTTK